MRLQEIFSRDLASAGEGRGEVAPKATTNWSQACFKALYTSEIGKREKELMLCPPKQLEGADEKEICTC